MSENSEPSEDPAVASPTVAQAAMDDYEWRVYRARVSAARALVAIRRRFGKPIPDEVLALAAEDYEARRPVPGPRLADEDWRVHRARVSAARGLLLMHQRTGRPISDEVRALAAEDYNARRPTPRSPAIQS